MPPHFLCRPLVCLAALGLLAATAGCGPEKPPAVAEAEQALPEEVDFNLHIRPILSDRCFACHGPDNNARKADLRLDTPEGAFAELPENPGRYAVVPGRLGRSEMFRRIVSTDEEERMPPPESNLSLSPEEIAYLTRWIEQGAEYKPHWSLIPPERPEPPAVADTARVHNPIDPFVLAKLDAKGWTPAPEASRETLIRRVTLDLTGLPPTIDELDAFLADTSANAYEKVVDRLLASEAYGERMATEWLDVARYADTHGYQDDGLRNMWPWRDWVIGAFNKNLPYDDFVTWQLAGDLLPDATREQRLATAFNRNHMQSQEGGIVPEEYRVEYVADRTQTFATAFMGMTLECARCHDHKYDPFSQEEYYRLFAFFNSNHEWGQIPYSGEASPTVILTNDETDTRLAELRDQIAALEAKVDSDAPAYADGFAAWRDRARAGEAGLREIRLPDPIGHYPLDAVDADRKLVNRADPDRPARHAGDADKVPPSVEGTFDSALRLVGDGYIDMGEGFAFFERNESFSIGLWFNIEADSAEGPLITRSGGIFNGNRGYDVMLRADGTFTAGLHHVWPANSIEIETLEPVEARTWHHIVLTYDGSSRAAGIRLYMDGRPMRTRIITDHLLRSILHADGDSTNWGGWLPLTIGKRHEETLDGVLVDEMTVFDRRLTTLEVETLSGAEAPLDAALADPNREADLRDYYVSTQAPGRPALFRSLTALRGEENRLLTAAPQVMVMEERDVPRTAYILDRGAYDAPTRPVEPGTPEAVLPFPDDRRPDRLGLARWLFAPENPLTARVAVNRYWQLVFGRGLVATPEDFGSQGDLPSHPLLLDWLATEFRALDWDVKALVKTMVMSATYRQSSVIDPARRAEDPENEWLARGPSVRLTAEMVRDQALAASGLLVPTVGGPSVKPYQPPGLWKELATRNAVEYVQDHGDKLYRRSMYTIWKRTTPPPSMISFDAAERNFCSVRRQRTSTPLQALILLNDPQHLEAARVLAERLMTEEADLEGRIERAFRLFTSRRPAPDEAAVLRDLYAAEVAAFAAAPARADSLLGVGEYPRDAALPAAEVAALTVVNNTIMNFDAAVIQR